MGRGLAPRLSHRAVPKAAAKRCGPSAPMANLTITIDDRLLRQARMRALEDGTSVNAVLRAYLERCAGSGDAGDALGGFVRLARRSTVRDIRMTPPASSG